MTIMLVTPPCAILAVRGDDAELAETNPPSEEKLLRRIQAGDQEALLELHARYANLVYSVAYRVLEESMSAEEVTQDTFMRLWRKADSYDPEKGRFVTWLLTMTRRLAIDVLRQRQRREPRAGLLFMDEDPTLWENILAVEGGSELRRNLRSVMEALPVEQRDLIEMVYFYGLSHSEIAEFLGLPLGTVKTRIRLGMQKLRLAWSAEGISNPDQPN
jgi:RNA polymerase sigma-70 factor (ECF subfamily)